MKRIQVIGLPGSGKTTGILRYLESTTMNVHYLDIRNFAGRYRNRRFRDAVSRTSGTLIAESACGVMCTDTTVVAVRPPIEQVYSQLLERDNTLDEDYLSLLGTQMIAPHYTIRVPEELPNLLRRLLGG